jgi:hypothetical protein
MSLIFTNSSQDEYDDSGNPIAGFGDPIGLERPYHYKNNLKNTLIIPPNSKVAVQSVEFDRMPLTDIQKEDQLEWWLGEILDTGVAATKKTMGQTVSVPMPIFMEDDYQSPNQDYTRKEMAKFLQTQIRGYLLCPSYYGTAICNQFTTDLQRFNFEVTSLANTEHAAAAAGTGLGLPGTTTNGFQSWVQPTRANVDDPGLTIFEATNDGDNLHRRTATNPLYDGTASGGGADKRMWDVTECSPICRSYPISQTNGNAMFAFNDASAVMNEWDIGFTRGVTYHGDQKEGLWMDKVKRPGFVNGTPYDEQNFPVMDFMVSFRYDPTAIDLPGANKQIRCYQLKMDKNGLKRMEQIEYWQVAGGGFGGSNAPATIVDETNMVVGLGGMSGIPDRIKFTFLGETLKVELTDNTASAFYTICDSSDSTGRDKRGVWKSVDMNSWGLYPRINMSHSGQNTHIYEYDSPMIDNQRNRNNVANVLSYDYPLDPDDWQNVDRSQTESGGYVFSPGSSWWANRYLQAEATENDDGDITGFPTNREVLQRTELIDQKTFNLPHGDANCEDSPWIGLDGDNQNPAYVHSILAQRNNTTMAEANITPARALTLPGTPTPKYGIVPCETSTMALALGLADLNPIQAGEGPNVLGVTSKRDGSGAGSTNYGKWVVQSINDVTILAKTLLVSCHSLTHQSYNFCINAPSKFLYHCPRFTADGRSSGRMFFEPAEKTYVTLNNPNELHIQDLEVKLTDKNGRPAKDLQGSTSVVFHIDQ